MKLMSTLILWFSLGVLSLPLIGWGWLLAKDAAPTTAPYFSRLTHERQP